MIWAEFRARGFVEDPAGVDLDAGRRADGENDVLDGCQCAQGAADEIGISGGIDQVDLLAVGLEVEEVAVDGEMAAFLFVFDVGDTGSVVDRPAAVGGACGIKKGVGKAGLARRPMSSEGNVADVCDVIGRGHWRCVSPQKMR